MISLPLTNPRGRLPSSWVCGALVLAAAVAAAQVLFEPASYVSARLELEALSPMRGEPYPSPREALWELRLNALAALVALGVAFSLLLRGRDSVYARSLALFLTMMAGIFGPLD